jgi:hypothetical protein
MRHPTEDELLLALLGEEAGPAARHVQTCATCSAVSDELRAALDAVAAWSVPEVPEETWQARRAALMANIRRAPPSGLLGALGERLHAVWNYALENPLPALGYVAAAVAFASERTITVFQLDQILPGTNEVFELLRRML